MVLCRIRVTYQNGGHEEYEGIFPTTMDAATDAIDRFGVVKVNVTALENE
jgi:hypothetical protein